jgi:hypothetical protein
MAAARAGVTVSLDEVERFCRQASAGHGLLFVEGAGGVMSPLGSGFLNIDLMARLKAKAILVCGGYLGTISHTLTALAALKATGCSGCRDCPVRCGATAGAAGGDAAVAAAVTRACLYSASMQVVMCRLRWWTRFCLKAGSGSGFRSSRRQRLPRSPRLTRRCNLPSSRYRSPTH